MRLIRVRKTKNRTKKGQRNRTNFFLNKWGVGLKERNSKRRVAQKQKRKKKKNKESRLKPFI